MWILSRRLSAVFLVFESLLNPARHYAGSDKEIYIVAYDAPEEGNHERHAGAMDEVAVVGSEKPFADAGAARGGADHEADPHDKLSREDYQLVGSGGESEKKRVDHEIAR